MENKQLTVAYFSMEFAFSKDIPNYAGGLGVLAADTMYSCADMGIEAVGISLLYHQDEDPSVGFDPSKMMKKRDEMVEVEIEGRRVQIVIWQMDIVGTGGHIVPVFFLSSNLPGNTSWDRDLTRYLYASDRYTRLGQEAILGIGGYRALKKMGYSDINCYHMNEGHTALLTLERLRANGFNKDVTRSKCTFTTHTPIPAGHDYFDYDLAYKTLGSMLPENIKDIATYNSMGMTQLAMNLSRSTNSVSEKHRQVCEQMFPGHDIQNVTNGIYHSRWVGKHIQELFDVHFKDWANKPSLLAQAPKILPTDALAETRKKEKKDFIGWINQNPEFFAIKDMLPEDYFDEETLTIGFARRFVPYKRPDLIFRDIDRLRTIGYKKLQLIFACKCHPDDAYCTHTRDDFFRHGRELRGQVEIVVIPAYNLEVAKRLVAGCDVWLNTPVISREASGTSGMKAALNGILNLSANDGWWIEGYDRAPKSGWIFGKETLPHETEKRDNDDNDELLTALEDVVDCYYNRNDEWIDRMKHAISLGAFFNTHRLVEEYNEKIWSPKEKPSS